MTIYHLFSPPATHSSINLVDGPFFYPCSGREVENDFTKHPNIVNIELTPVRNPSSSSSAAVAGVGCVFWVASLVGI